MGRYIVTNGPCGQRHGLFPNYFGYLLMYITVGTVYRIYLGSFKTACCHVDLVVVKCVDMCYTRIFVVCAYSDLRITYTSLVSSCATDCTKCMLCQKDTDEHLTKLTDRGLKTLLETSETRGDAEITQYLQGAPAFVVVHNACRKRYTDVRKLDRQYDDSEEVQPVKRLRSQESVFSWKEMCFFVVSLSMTEQLWTVDVDVLLRLNYEKVSCSIVLIG